MPLRTPRVLYMLHADLIGPIGIQTPQKQSYILTIVDDYSGYAWAELLYSKDQASSAIQVLNARMNVETGEKINTLKCDQGTEFVNQDLKGFCRDYGILLDMVPRYTPQLNGVAERYNRRIVEGVCSMLLSSGLPRRYWGLAVQAYVYVANRVLTSARNAAGQLQITPYEVYHGSQPRYNHLRIWGCPVTYFVPKEARADKFKFSSRTAKGHFIGYRPSGYQILTAQNSLLDVPFDEVVFHEVARQTYGAQEFDLMYESFYPPDLSDTQSESGLMLGESSTSCDLTQNPDQSRSSCGESSDNMRSTLGERHVDQTNVHDNDQHTPNPQMEVGGSDDVDVMPTGLVDDVYVNTQSDVSQVNVQVSGSNVPQENVNVNVQDLNVNANDQEPNVNVNDQEPNVNVRDDADATNVQAIQQRSACLKVGGKRISRRLRNISAESNPLEQSEEQEDEEDALVNKRLKRLVEELKIDMNTRADIKALSSQVKINELIDDFVQCYLSKLEVEEMPYDVTCLFNEIYCGSDIPVTPKTVAEAMLLKEWPQWKAAMEDELRSLLKHGTWKRSILPQGFKALPCKWVFKIKLDSSGQVERFKARLVIQGFRQVKDVDYTETFAPVAKFNTIRMVIAIAAKYDMIIHQMDVNTAFLNGILNEEIYMKGPVGTEFEGQILRLLRSLYGLKQAPKCWNNTIHQFLVEIGFKRSHADNCLYIRRKHGRLFMIVLYVDDILLITQRQSDIDAVIAQLAQRFDMKDLGPAEHIVGIRIKRSMPQKIIQLDQRTYLERVLTRFEADNCVGVSTPMSLQAINVDVDDGFLDVSYRALIGSLMYLMVGTRPDIAFVVGYLSKYLSNPKMEHYSMVRRVLRYLAGSKDLVLIFDGKKDLLPIAYADADFANDQEGRRSTTGYVIQMCGASISWKSKLQSAVALSSTEAEYYAAAAVCQELCWFREILNEVGLDIVVDGLRLLADEETVDRVKVHPLKVMEDNQSCIAITKNPEKFSRTKHIEVKYHFVRELTESGRVMFEYVNTQEQTADVLTKPLTPTLFRRHVARLGLDQSRC
ncbi:hypothetical protein MIR68_005316 [Amoeboaphelidium protococcarum]|nr:hypothetical protein MIR68_005316 [Amoeboaphelidium protococcarum]